MGEGTGWQQEGDEKRGDRMLTRGRGEERRGEGEEIGWQQEGEENLIPIDKDIFNPLFLCSIAGHTHRMVMRGRGDDLDDENGGSTLMHCVCVST